MPGVAALRTATFTLAATAILAATPALANGPMGGSMGGSPPVNTSSAASTPRTAAPPSITTGPALSGSPTGGFPRLGMPPAGRPAPADIPVMRAAPDNIPVMRADTGIAAARSAAWQQLNDNVDMVRNGGVGTALVTILTRDPRAARAASGADSMLTGVGGLAAVPPITVRPVVPPVGTVNNPAGLRSPALSDTTTVLKATEAAVQARLQGATRGTAAALRTPSNRIFTDLSSFPRRQTGGTPTPMEPSVQDALNNAPHPRPGWHGKCAEPGCVSQTLSAGQVPGGGMSTAVGIQDLVPKPPCTSCQSVLDSFGVTAWPPRTPR
ncbi:hypothetical protein [Azospirillum sp. TSO22-1]|uniref:hypothetical protein n=1 Tax=Azospirillum sp. TSO22-1 TaxID=716789 RepID=UPI000D6085C5|nr:hypothetical protein [Azospirillum sp. TSO22-1]PWC41394.1 hypothetical protein TSO221_23565 [Azospirillum sp. TSO22-1]